MRRRLWLLLIVLLVAVAIGDSLVWHFAVQRMRAGLDDWVAARRATGWSVSSATPEAGGWPLAATLTLRDVALLGGAPDIPNGLAWRAERVVLRLAMLHPQVLRVEAEGAQHLRMSDAPDIPYTAAHLHLLVPLQADPSVQALDLHGETIRASVPVSGVPVSDVPAANVPAASAPATSAPAAGVPVSGATNALTLERLDVDAVLHPAAGPGHPAVIVAGKADGVRLPAQLHSPLGSQIASVVLDATLNGPLRDAVGLTAAATAWRDDGGSLDVRRFEAHWGVLGLTATATLALDPELQPMGTGTAQVTGYAATLDTLARNGLMSRSAATTAKAVLSLLANAPDDGRSSEVEVPLSLQYRTLSMRQVPLVRLPELDWPQQ